MAIRIVVESDNVGYTCSDECASEVLYDIRADLGPSIDAGGDQVINPLGLISEPCMSCGKVVTS